MLGPSTGFSRVQEPTGARRDSPKATQGRRSPGLPLKSVTEKFTCYLELPRLNCFQESRGWSVTFSPTLSHGLRQDTRPELEREHEPISRRETQRFGESAI